MLTGNGGNVKLIDFGFSDADSYAVLKQPAGTWRYAAPEQEAGLAVDARADIYALGVIMGEINGALPRKWARLWHVAARCTKADAALRYASAGEIITALTAPHTARRAAIAATSLAVGELVEIGWPPDRYCLVRHTGGGRFVVEEASNCKLHAGDTFSASLFCTGQPLYVTGLSQGGGRPASYVAGMKHGLTLARIKNRR